MSRILITRVGPVSSLIAARAFAPTYFQVARMSDKSSLDANKGGVGSAFKETGSVGGKAQEVGGPFDKEGSIGSKFTEDGSIGGTAQKAAEQAQGDKPSMFDTQGAVGKMFTTDGAIGGTADAIGGPLSKDGMFGSKFTTSGSIGSTVQKNLGDKK